METRVTEISVTDGRVSLRSIRRHEAVPGISRVGRLRNRYGAGESAEGAAGLIVAEGETVSWVGRFQPCSPWLGWIRM